MWKMALSLYIYICYYYLAGITSIPSRMLFRNDYVEGLHQQTPPTIRSLLEKLNQHRASTQESQTDAKNIRGTKYIKVKNLHKSRIKRQSDLIQKCCRYSCSYREMTMLCQELYW